jgi:hypothetical protein
VFYKKESKKNYIYLTLYIPEFFLSYWPNSFDYFKNKHFKSLFEFYLFQPLIILEIDSFGYVFYIYSATKTKNILRFANKPTNRKNQKKCHHYNRYNPNFSRFLIRIKTNIHTPNNLLTHLALYTQMSDSHPCTDAFPRCQKQLKAEDSPPELHCVESANWSDLVASIFVASEV